MDDRWTRLEKAMDAHLNGSRVRRVHAHAIDKSYDKYFEDTTPDTVYVTVRCDLMPSFRELCALNEMFGGTDVVFDAFDGEDGTIDLNWNTTYGQVKYVMGPDDGMFCHAHDCPYPTSRLGHDTCGYSPKPEPREMLFECVGCPTTVRITQVTGTEGPEGWSAVPGSNGRLCCTVCCSDEQVLADFKKDYEA